MNNTELNELFNDYLLNQTEFLWLIKKGKATTKTLKREMTKIKTIAEIINHEPIKNQDELPDTIPEVININFR